MAPAKAKGGKKKATATKKKSAKSARSAGSEGGARARPLFFDADDEGRLAARAAANEDVVEVTLQLVSWRFGDIRARIHANCSLGFLARAVEERHGHVDRLQLFLGPPSAETELTDWSLTPARLGCKRGQLALFYDFTAHRCDAATLREPCLLLHDPAAAAAAAAANATATQPVAAAS
jgi:hypothetical protein